jgi:hypothetical protein
VPLPKLLLSIAARAAAAAVPGSLVVSGLSVLFGACSSARVGASETGAPSITLPARFAEGSGEGDAGAEGGPAPLGAAGHAEAGAATSSAPGSPPDPEPVTSAVHWDHALHYAKGEITVERVTRVDLPSPAPSPRRMGRFAIELWIGRELVDRVRFDFPLLAADVPEGRKRPLHDSPRFAPGADTRTTVRIPASDRATRAVLVDRQTGRTQALTWPPVPAAAPPAIGPAASATAPRGPAPAPTAVPPASSGKPATR